MSNGRESSIEKGCIAMSIFLRIEVLTIVQQMGYLAIRNTPVSFGEGARSRSERTGSCFFQGASA
jgi:hypothetical protein